MSNVVNAATELQWLPSLSVDGYGDFGPFDKQSGGEATASITKYRPGGMGDEISYLSLPVYGALTITRVYDQARDDANVALLRTLVGRIYATVTSQGLDNNGNPYGTPRTYYGRISGLNDGNVDSTSNAPRMWDIVIEVENVSN